MSVSELPRTNHAAPQPVQESQAVSHPAQDDVEMTDAEFARVFRHGVMFGIPVMYLVVGLVCLLAVPEQPILLVAALWPAVWGGWYFGGIVALAVFEERRPRQATSAAIAKTPSGRQAPPRPAAIAH